MVSPQDIYEDPIGYLFFRESIWTRYLGLEASPITLALCFICALSLMVICIECTLSMEAGSAHHHILLGVRTLSAIPTGALFLDAVFAPHVTQNRHIESAIATIGLYGLFKTWEICIAPLLDGVRLPKWIKASPRPDAGSNGARQISAESNGDNKVGSKHDRTYKKVKVGYSVDLLSTLRGVSWLADRHFDFLTSQVVSEQANSSSRLSFIRERLLHFLLVCLCYDVCDSITKLQSWMKAEDLLQAVPDGRVTKTSPLASAFAHQITTRPLYHQMVFVLIVAVTTQLSLESFYTLFAVLCVGVFGVSPKAFPHFFGSPISLQTDTVRSFWGARWHHIFRRVYDRAIDPWLYVLGISKRSTIGIVLKVTAVFTVSGIVHSLIQARALVYHFPPGMTAQLVDEGSLWFFMSQPLALFFEHLVIRPVTRRLPGPLAYVIRRVWTWSWLFWSGRWWADTWVKMGMWQPDEQVVFFSPIRGIWKGEWIVKTQ
jgi:Membrane bound O-acyl transferase family